MKKILLSILSLFAAVMLLTGNAFATEKRANEDPVSVDLMDTNFLEISVPEIKNKSDIQLYDRARFTLECLKTKDWNRLAGVSHPVDGVKFSPYAYLDENVIKLSTEQIKNLNAEERVYIWGVYDGSGEPIELSFSDYYLRFIYDKDFINAPDVGINRVVRTGNTFNNIDEVFGADTAFVEFHYPGAGPSEDFSWASLRLVFKKYQNTWYLVGIVHDRWTI
jgi:hypothetical protein